MASNYVLETFLHLTRNWNRNGTFPQSRCDTFSVNFGQIDLFLLITHESAVLREVHSIEHSGLRIKKWEERGKYTALIQIIKRKPFSPFFFFLFVVVFRNELGPK